MKRFISFWGLFLYIMGVAWSQIQPPYNNVAVYFHSNLTRTQFDAMTSNDIQNMVQKANNIIYKKFWEIFEWDEEDEQMV